MDEVENPNLPAAGESSPTLHAVDEAEDTTTDALGPSEQTDSADTVPAIKQDGSLSPLPQPRANVPARPPLRRDSSAPPPQQPPPAPPSQQVDNMPQDPPDSLTLAELRRIRSTGPNTQAPPKQALLEDQKIYDFEYDDTQSFPVELEEWFSYGDEEQRKLRKCKDVFNMAWDSHYRSETQSDGNVIDWLAAPEQLRKSFVTKLAHVLHGEETWKRLDALLSLTYVALGNWDETAGRIGEETVAGLFGESEIKPGARFSHYASSSLQIQSMLRSVEMLLQNGVLEAVYSTLREICEADFAYTGVEQNPNMDAQPRRGDESTALWCSLTLMYVFVETARTTKNTSAGETLSKRVIDLQPNLLVTLTDIVARLRWDEQAPIPLTKMLLLAWKTVLICFGGFEDIDTVKASLRKEDPETDTSDQPIITASPLDYHLFRQEINSKYPAYQPPPPLFPLEPENNSILPPLKHRRPSFTTSDSAPWSMPATGSHSIMHQPVHIATPAPSPPPSPAAGGKTGKKQNYQTNQMFPFLYPPLDAASNEMGGKGATELQDVLVGRRWEGSDIPTSILEAAELFAKRMRATRAMKQLWETRVDFMRYERGWRDSHDIADQDVDDFEFVPKPAPEETAEQGAPIGETDPQRILRAVGDFYKNSLPYLQSVVIVLLKAVLQNVTDLVTKGNGQNGLQAGISFNEPNGTNGSAKPIENGNSRAPDGNESTAEELNNLRSQEIAAKALSAILLLFLKWFKVSHILQYEYMTQLLLDSNYVPLILKLWQTQDIGRACHYQLERVEQNFFYWCQANSRQGVQKSNQDGKPAQADQESEDEAAPPPIKLRRDDPDQPVSPRSVSPDLAHLPEVDELGYPQTFLPTEPLKAYSWRNIFSFINYLRILQKITRRKTHRSLLLVSYKSSNHLKKTLRIPIQPLRYYTLKLFKSQVPFCGRKWRQGNMKIITAVWLSVPAELRDDWLTGGGGGMGGAGVGDVDGTVEEALPLEQSLRALTHWWNVRNFPEVMGIDKGLLDEEMDFFVRELEKMEVARGDEEMSEDHSMEGAEAWQGPLEGY